MIYGYIGLPGTGKTLNMVRDCMEDMISGRTVLSNTPIRFEHKGQEYKSIFVASAKNFEQEILKARDMTIAIDEASVFFPSNFWRDLPGEFIIKFAQTRKYKLDFRYTTQGLKHTIKRLRDLTNLIGKCQNGKFFGKDIFKITWFDPEFFEHQILNPDRIQEFIVDRKTIYYSEAKRIFKAYDTDYFVEASALFSTENDRQH